MRKLEFEQRTYSNGSVYLDAQVGPVTITTFANTQRGASIYVTIEDRGGFASKVRTSATGPTDDDAIAEAEALLRRDHPRAWELYARTVLVGSEVAA